MDKRAFYEQVKSVSELLGGILGSDFKEELLKFILLSSLTDSQALDVVNTLARNIEWLKTLSSGERIDALREIVKHVKKGETCNEAIQKVKKKDEELFEAEVALFYAALYLSDTQLAEEVSNLLECVKDRLGPRAALWLLSFLKDVYSKAFSTKSMEAANAELRNVVEKVFRYPESTSEGCAIASSIVHAMMEGLSPIIRMLRELRDLLYAQKVPHTDKRVADLIGDIGEEYAKLYLKDDIKEVVSRKTGIPKEELEVVWSTEKGGPDFYVYHKGKLIAIGDVKATIDPDVSLSKLWERAIDQSLKKKYFMGKWKDQFNDVEYGVPVGVRIKADALDQALAKWDLKDVIEAGVRPDPYPNPNYKP
jgi:hypothetical protein